jgi:hypothetical protein
LAPFLAPLPIEEGGFEGMIRTLGPRPLVLPAREPAGEPAICCGAGRPTAAAAAAAALAAASVDFSDDLWSSVIIRGGVRPDEMAMPALFRSVNLMLRRGRATLKHRQPTAEARSGPGTRLIQWE